MAGVPAHITVEEAVHSYLIPQNRIDMPVLHLGEQVGILSLLAAGQLSRAERRALSAGDIAHFAAGAIH